MPVHGTIQWHAVELNGTRWCSISIQWQFISISSPARGWRHQGHQGSSGVIRYHQGSSAHLLEDGEHISPELLWKGGEREHERRLREIVDEYQLVPAQLREWPEPAASELVRGDEDNQ